jgi:aminopeptidase
MDYTPPAEQLERYASVLVNYALADGAGISPGQVVQVTAPEIAKPLYVEVCRAVWRAGGHVIPQYLPDDDERFNLGRDFYTLAGDDQLAFFPAEYRRALVDLCDHSVHLLGAASPHALAGIPPARLLAHRRAQRPYADWRTDKEAAGRFTWTLALYGTPGMAAEAGMSIEEYWEQIVAACFLDREDPIAAWREVGDALERIRGALNALPISRLHVTGPDADLWLTLGEQRQWVAGRGRNIPSFEVFTSPDWRGTEGWIRFSEPLYVYGSLIEGIELAFADGRVRRASATTGEPLLQEMVATEGADRVGEFSLTDARLSRITRFMADTLYDENVGGRYGNTHLALGRALKDCYAGDPGPLSDADWERLAFNDSAVHTDIVSTADREVTAVLADGSERVIYADGRFQLEGLGSLG